MNSGIICSQTNPSPTSEIPARFTADPAAGAGRVHRYARNEDGSVAVVNRGYRAEESTWEQAEGIARFVGEETTAHLKVSFFGPFYSSYVVFELGEEYEYAFVSGYNRDYLWLLSRTPEVDEAVKARFVARAAELGFAVDELLMVDQSRHASP